MKNMQIVRDMIEKVLKGTPTEKVARCLVDAKGKFMTITMRPDASDIEKRGGKQRVYNVNIAEQWLTWEKNHGLGDGILKESAIPMLRTKFERGIITVCESVHGEGGRFTRQVRSINLAKVESIAYGGNTYRF